MRNICFTCNIYIYIYIYIYNTCISTLPIVVCWVSFLVPVILVSAVSFFLFPLLILLLNSPCAIEGPCLLILNSPNFIHLGKL